MGGVQPNQEATTYTGALSFFSSNHMLHLRRSGTRSFHVLTEEEEQEMPPNPDSTPNRNVSPEANTCALMSYPPMKQGRGTALTAGASRSPTGQVDEGEYVIE